MSEFVIPKTIHQNLFEAVHEVTDKVLLFDEMQSIRSAVDQDDREDFEQSDDFSEIRYATGSTVKLLFQAPEQAKAFMEHMYHHYGLEYCKKLAGTPDKLEYDFTRLLIKATDD